MANVAVVDYGMGNLHSARKGLERAGLAPEVTDSGAAIEAADAVVLPGVGSFDPAVRALRSQGLVAPIERVIAAGTPFLGICLGMQVLFEGSEEGSEPGLGLVAGTVRRFRREPGLAIPHMGWNELQLAQPHHALWQGLPERPSVYFVHSYYAVPRDASTQAATTQHGSQTVTAAIARANLMALQFHPEKSSGIGLQILANFASGVRAQVAA